jgi:hypothetical protein
MSLRPPVRWVLFSTAFNRRGIQFYFPVGYFGMTEDLCTYAVIPLRPLDALIIGGASILMSVDSPVD